MLSKSKIKFVRSLQLRKYRQKYHKIVVEGTKIVSDIVKESLMSFDEIYATEAWITLNSELLTQSRGEVIAVTQTELSKVSGFKAPQPVLAIGSPPQFDEDLTQPELQLCLYLDGVRDPGNLGTILRIADWFGIAYVYLSDDCAELHNPKVIQSSMSSVFQDSCYNMSIVRISG